MSVECGVNGPLYTKTLRFRCPTHRCTSRLCWLVLAAGVTDLSLVIEILQTSLVTPAPLPQAECSVYSLLNEVTAETNPSSTRSLLRLKLEALEPTV